MKQIFEEIAAERARQDAKWGEQNHDNSMWDMIATEEKGEISQAILHDEFGGDHAGTLRDELVQLGAVVVAWLQCLDRNERAGVDCHAHGWRAHRMSALRPILPTDFPCGHQDIGRDQQRIHCHAPPLRGRL